MSPVPIVSVHFGPDLFLFLLTDSIFLAVLWLLNACIHRHGPAVMSPSVQKVL